MAILQLISDVVVIAAMVVTMCSIVVAVRPAPEGDTWKSKLYRVINVLALNVGHAKK